MDKLLQMLRNIYLGHSIENLAIPLKKSTPDIKPGNSRCIYSVWAPHFSMTLSLGHIGSIIVDWCAGFVSFASTRFPHKTYKQRMPASFSGNLTSKYYTINGELNASSSSVRVFTKSRISQLKLFKKDRQYVTHNGRWSAR
jgi:hypothetical protein